MSKSKLKKEQEKQAAEVVPQGPTKKDIALQRQEVADKAFISAVKTLTQMQRASDLMAYSKHPRIQKSYQTSGYQISISFALHVGRAIECAIGSEFKVDALYLSAETQVALRLDQLCDEYDRQIILSGDLVQLLSEKAKQFTRRIDCVQMEESRGMKKVSIST